MSSQKYVLTSHSIAKQFDGLKTPLPTPKTLCSHLCWDCCILKFYLIKSMFLCTRLALSTVLFFCFVPPLREEDKCGGVDISASCKANVLKWDISMVAQLLVCAFYLNHRSCRWAVLHYCFVQCLFSSLRCLFDLLRTPGHVFCLWLQVRQVSANIFRCTDCNLPLWIYVNVPMTILLDLIPV